jgi:hypothetical protein
MATEGISDVHYFEHTMSGMPELRFLAGSLISLLDVCLTAQGGWEKIGGATVAAYRSIDPDGTQCYLRVDDTHQQYARLVGYETMTDENTGVGPFPTSAQFSDGLYFTKAGDQFHNPKKWSLFCSNRAIYMFGTSDTPFYDYGYQRAFFFGDIVPAKLDDRYHCLLIGQNAATNASMLPTVADTVSGNQASYIARSYTQEGTSIACPRYSLWPMTYVGSVGDVYPSPLDGKLRVYPVDCLEGFKYRGRLPGFYSPLLEKNNQPTGTIIEDNTVGHSGRNFYLQSISRGNTNDFRAAIDITGPWHSNGSLSIAGIVTELLVPGSYRVNLYRQSDMQLVDSVWSGEDGAYSFTGLANQKYVVMAIDHTNPLRSPAIQDNVIPS